MARTSRKSAAPALTPQQKSWVTRRAKQAAAAKAAKPARVSRATRLAAKNALVMAASN